MVTRKKNDDTDPFAFSSKDYKAPQAKRTKNALVPSTRIRDLTSKKDYGYLELREIIWVAKKLGEILKSKLP